MKQCFECKWCRPDRGIVSWFGLTKAKWEFAKCHRPELTMVHPNYAKAAYCEIERKFDIGCGVEAKHWEAA